MDYEVIIIGCGPAGLSAGIYLGRAKVKTLIIGKVSQSQLIKAHKIENYFGFSKGITGRDLLKEGIKQVKKFGVKLIDDEVVGMYQTKKGFKIKTGKENVFSCEVVILATGTPIRLSGIENEEKLTGKGVHYCVECDGAFYKDKKVVVIGNGNHAAENAVDLRIFAKDVYIISNADEFKFSQEMKHEIEKHNIKLINAKILAFEGEKFLENIVMEKIGKVEFDGAFMACGTASALDFSSKLGLSIKENILQVDENNMTNVVGVFAVGNCSGKCRQVAKNVGDGCNAGLSAIRYLRHEKNYVDYGSRRE